MATKFKIITGEDEVTVSVRPGHILRIEREEQEQELSPVESTYRMAWMASGTTTPFEEWIESVDDIIPILPKRDDADKDDEEGEAIPPTTVGSRRSRRTQG